MVLDRNVFHKVHSRTHIVREVAEVGDLRQVYALDHLVFGDPIPAPGSMARELKRLGSRRRIFFIPGYEGIAKAAGGVTHFPDWSLLWGGETHPAFRRQGLYQAVLAARIEAAKQTSATFVAVYANNDTSMPILQKDGFEPIASIEVWKSPETRSASGCHRQNPVTRSLKSYNTHKDGVGHGRITDDTTTTATYPICGGSSHR